MTSGVVVRWRVNKKNWDIYFDAVRRQQWEIAKNALKGVIAEEADNPQTFLRLGDVYQKTGETRQAIVLYHRCAGLLRDRGFAQKAAALYRIILRLDPHDREALDRSSEILRESEADRRRDRAAPQGCETTVSCPDAEAPQVSAGRKVPKLFSCVSEDEFRTVRERLDLKSFADGEKVIEEGDSGDSLFLIESGSARVVAHLQGREVELAILGEGDVFGEVAFLTGRPRTASVIARGPLRVYEIGRLDIERIIEKNSGVLSVLEDFYESRLKDTIRKVKPG
jgi:CRP-like cAMP-binding protein